MRFTVDDEDYRDEDTLPGLDLEEPALDLHVQTTTVTAGLILSGRPTEARCVQVAEALLMLAGEVDTLAEVSGSQHLGIIASAVRRQSARLVELTEQRVQGGSW